MTRGRHRGFARRRLDRYAPGTTPLPPHRRRREPPPADAPPARAAPARRLRPRHGSPRPRRPRRVDVAPVPVWPIGPAGPPSPRSACARRRSISSARNGPDLVVPPRPSCPSRRPLSGSIAAATLGRPGLGWFLTAAAVAVATLVAVLVAGRTTESSTTESSTTESSTTGRRRPKVRPPNGRPPDGRSSSCRPRISSLVSPGQLAALVLIGVGTCARLSGSSSSVYYRPSSRPPWPWPAGVRCARCSSGPWPCRWRVPGAALDDPRPSGRPWWLGECGRTHDGGRPGGPGPARGLRGTLRRRRRGVRGRTRRRPAHDRRRRDRALAIPVRPDGPRNPRRLLPRPRTARLRRRRRRRDGRCAASSGRCRSGCSWRCSRASSPCRSRCSSAVATTSFARPG